MADERLTTGWHVVIETVADDGTGVTLSRDVPHNVSVTETIADGIRAAGAGVWRESIRGSHPDVSDSAAREHECGCLEAPYCLPHGGTVLSDTCLPHDHVDPAADPLTTARKLVARTAWEQADAAEAVRLHMAVCPCLGGGVCEPHTARLSDGSGCEAHGYIDGIEPSDSLEPVEPEKASAILNAWDAGWRPKDGPQPVEPDELARDRAEQLVTALAVALRAWLPPWPVTVMNHETMARALLAHSYVRKALEPARAVVFADPLGTIVSFSYPDSVTPTKATHVRVRLEPGVVVGSGHIGRQVAVVK